MLYFKDFNAKSKKFFNLVASILNKVLSEVNSTKAALNLSDEDISLNNYMIICKILIWIQLFIKTNEKTADENEFRIVIDIEQVKNLYHFYNLTYGRKISLNEIKHCYFMPDKLLMNDHKIILRRFILNSYDKYTTKYLNKMCERLLCERMKVKNNNFSYSFLMGHIILMKNYFQY